VRRPASYAGLMRSLRVGAAPALAHYTPPVAASRSTKRELDPTADPDQPPLRPLTTAEIAELAGVSIATVSKVLNGRADVASATRAMVEQVIRERGHRRQKRPSERAPLVELLSHQLEGDYSIDMIKGVQSVIGPQGLALVVTDYGGGTAPEADWARGVLARRSVGVVAAFATLGPHQLDRLSARGVPLVLVDPTGEPEHGVLSVGAANWDGGLVATRHLLGLGHRRIAVITGPPQVLSSRARLDGFRAAMSAAGVPIDHRLVCPGNFEIEDGIHHGRELLRRAARPTAIFAFNDGMALGVYQAVAEAGLRIPGDISVVGFDDLPGSRWMIPKLTTVRQPLADMAAVATHLLLALVRGEAPARTRTVLATDLVVRASTGPAPRGPDET
jgi:LacI family transcriptional regulator, xylobiose transport system transcriptional regulator